MELSILVMFILSVVSKTPANPVLAKAKHFQQDGQFFGQGFANHLPKQEEQSFSDVSLHEFHAIPQSKDLDNLGFLSEMKDKQTKNFQQDRQFSGQDFAKHLPKQEEQFFSDAGLQEFHTIPLSKDSHDLGFLSMAEDQHANFQQDEQFFGQDFAKLLPKQEEQFFSDAVLHEFHTIPQSKDSHDLGFLSKLKDQHTKHCQQDNQFFGQNFANHLPKQEEQSFSDAGLQEFHTILQSKDSHDLGFLSKSKDQHTKNFQQDENFQQHEELGQNFANHLPKEEEQFFSDTGLHEFHTIPQSKDSYNLGFLSKLKDQHAKHFQQDDQFFGQDFSNHLPKQEEQLFSAAGLQEFYTIPHSKDWRNLGFVSKIKDQGQCAACWAFAAVATVEAQLFKKTKAFTELSEQNLIDCAQSFKSQGCNGGWVYKAFDYIRDAGIEMRSSYPFEEKKKYCKFDSSLAVDKITDYKKLKWTTESKIMEIVANHGPVTVAVHMSPAFLKFKGSGIFDDPDCTNVVNHVVTVVGYVNNATEKYWIIKNSWGLNWGDQGYMKMIMGKNMCGLTTLVEYPMF